MNDRLAQLQKMLQQQPTDPFLLYGIAMEHKKRNDSAAAIEFLNRAIQSDPNYSYAYFQRGQVQEQLSDMESAKESYRRGIDVARISGDAHAQSELQGALEMLG
jgi:tetratricopeptide (TPR) repeat protein